MSTKIAWCDETWNPVVGCSKVSAGCENCYAEKMANRQSSMELSRGKTGPYGEVVSCYGTWNGKTVFVESTLEKPLHWKKPRTIFVCSMSDLFHETVPFEWIDTIFAVMALCPQHRFMLLTKRAERMAEYICDNECANSKDMGEHIHWVANQIRDWHGDEVWPLPNVHIGVTVENQKAADERIPVQLKIPAAKRFISLEPLLEKIDSPTIDSTGPTGSKILFEDIDYAFIGCESGPGARLCTQDDIRHLRDQLQDAGVKVGIKQIPRNDKCSKYADRDNWPEDLQVWEIEQWAN